MWNSNQQRGNDNNQIHQQQGMTQEQQITENREFDLLNDLNNLNLSDQNQENNFVQNYEMMVDLLQKLEKIEIENILHISQYTDEQLKEIKKFENILQRSQYAREQLKEVKKFEHILPTAHYMRERLQEIKKFENILKKTCHYTREQLEKVEKLQNDLIMKYDLDKNHMMLIFHMHQGKENLLEEILEKKFDDMQVYYKQIKELLKSEDSQVNLLLLKYDQKLREFVKSRGVEEQQEMLEVVHGVEDVEDQLCIQVSSTFNVIQQLCQGVVEDPQDSICKIF